MPTPHPQSTAKWAVDLARLANARSRCFDESIPSWDELSPEQQSAQIEGVLTTSDVVMWSFTHADARPADLEEAERCKFAAMDTLKTAVTEGLIERHTPKPGMLVVTL